MQDNEKYINTLKDILEISIKQKELLEENRLSEVLELQQKRDALISSIKDYAVKQDDASKKETARLVRQILDNDSVLMIKIMSGMEDIKKELKSSVSGRKVVRAYK